MFNLQNWLAEQMRRPAIRNVGAPVAIEWLSAQLDWYMSAFGFVVTEPVWLSSRFEEGEVTIRWPDGHSEKAAVCLVPMRIGRGREATA